MLIDHSYRPEHAVSRKADPRYATNLLWLDPEGWLHATDGALALRVRMDLADEDTPGPVTVEALKAARTVGGHLLCTNDTLRVAGGPTFRRPQDLTAPAPPVTRLWADHGDPDGASATVPDTWGASLWHTLGRALNPHPTQRPRPFRWHRRTETGPLVLVDARPDHAQPQWGALLVPYEIL